MSYISSNKKNKVALIDCNSFYVSCERLFNPKIIKKPVVVLSNNDGCVISRSTEAKKIVADAKSIDSAGVFSMVVEAVKESLGKKITNNVSVPTVGIGAGKYCDGQILVTDDMLGLSNTFTPKFVKKYANLYNNINEALKNYKNEVLNGKFPSSKNIYN